MAKDRTIVETEYYELPLDFYLKCEYIAAQLEITVDYLLAEFYDDEAHGIVVPDYVME
jgi:predicted DNA-binding ribbon-helix-helix protein